MLAGGRQVRPAAKHWSTNSAPTAPTRRTWFLRRTASRAHLAHLWTRLLSRSGTQCRDCSRSVPQARRIRRADLSVTALTVSVGCGRRPGHRDLGTQHKTPPERRRASNPRRAPNPDLGPATAPAVLTRSRCRTSYRRAESLRRPAADVNGYQQRQSRWSEEVRRRPP